MRRLADIFFSLFLLILLFIPCFAICLLIKFTSKGDVIYWSDRVGKGEKKFSMPKFRTMKTGAPIQATHLIIDPKNFLTPIGSFLRRASLDEIPQLYSILKGDLTFVGPRPALFNQMDLILLRRSYGVNNLVPGLTGWAQVNGRDEIDIHKKALLDKEYLSKRSLYFDIHILWLTFLKVTRREGVSH